MVLDAEKPINVGKYIAQKEEKPTQYFGHEIFYI
jgi:hypothetical protein